MKNGKYPETGVTTDKRAYSKGGLTHITDEVFEYFQALEDARLQVQSIGMGLQQGKDVLSVVSTSLLSNVHLQAKLINILPMECVAEQGVCEALFNYIIKSYLPVCNVTYRKDLLAELEQRKTLAHRQQIAATSSSAAQRRAGDGASTSTAGVRNCRKTSKPAKVRA